MHAYFGTIPSGTLRTWPMTAISIGDLSGNRESERIRVKSIHYEGVAGIESEPCFIRLAILWANYEQASGAGAMSAPTLPAIWDTVSGDGTWGPRNLEQATMWVILWERRIMLNQTTNYMKPLKIYKKLDHLVKYVGTASDAYSRGNLWLVATSDSVTEPHPALDGVLRVRFLDD